MKFQQQSRVIVTQRVGAHAVRPALRYHDRERAGVRRNQAGLV
jgi:hypothetical protein